MPPVDSSSISGRARNGVGVDAQDEFFQREWEDGDLIADLEAREEARATRLAANKEFKLRDDAVKARLLDYSLDVGEVARVGRFKIKKTLSKAREVSFETSPSERLTIGTIDVD